MRNTIYWLKKNDVQTNTHRISQIAELSYPIYLFLIVIQTSESLE